MKVMLVRPLMTNFKVTVGAHCAVSALELPPSVYKSSRTVVVSGEGSAFGQESALLCSPTTCQHPKQSKLSFPPTLPSLLAFELQVAGSHFWFHHHRLEKGMENHISILALRTAWIVWKGKKIWHWEMNPTGHWMSNMLLEKSGGKNSRRNREAEPKQKQRLFVDVSDGESKVQCCKNNIAEEPGIKVNWKWSKRRRQEWTSTF